MHISLIGTGLLGRATAERLLDCGHTLTVYNRTRARAEPLARRGARIVSNPREALGDSVITVFLVTDTAAIRELLFPGGAQLDLAGCTVLQMSTISPEESVSLMEETKNAGGDYLEAPVLGSRSEAREGKLIVMVGASSQQFSRFLPFFRALGPDPRRVGPVGQAAALKLALNQIIAAQVHGFALSLGLVRRRGIDPDLFLHLLRQSKIYAPTFDAKLPRLRDRNFANPNFPTRHFLKDANLIFAEADRLGLNTAVLDAFRRTIQRALEHSHADDDYSAIYDVIDPA